MDYVKIIISGIVQGVGFRPFLYNFLKNFPVTGSIQNTGNLGVTLLLKRTDQTFHFSDLRTKIQANLPSIALIERITMEEIDPVSTVDYSTLSIIKSNSGTGKGLTLPPDIAICDYCLTQFNDPSISRFYHYPFIACAECGPRFTIMRSLPYDRPNSTADQFPFCEECEEDYHDFKDRRFHAQTFNCSQCGPFYYQYQKDQPPPRYPPIGTIDDMVKGLGDGKIIAVKGLGGVNLICRADLPDVITKLRERKKKRKNKPFAVMLRDIQSVESHFYITPTQKSLLTSFRRPIVLLPKRDDFFPEEVAPGLPNIGIILPYMGIHHYFFKKLGDIPLIFTSGNVSSLPMAIKNADIIHQMTPLADSIYLHDREIYQRCDDSVIRPVLDSNLLIRRSRGYVPEYYNLPFTPKFTSILSVGAELTNTGAISRLDRVFPTQHIGNVTNLETYDFLHQSLHHMQQLLRIEDHEIQAIGHDAHPAFHSTRLAAELAHDIQNSHINPKSLQLYPIQHHHAHLASLMADHQIDRETQILCITADGVGYGADGSSWGGEILKGNYTDFSREGYIRPIPMIGGDLCAKYPDRMLLSLLLGVAQRRKNEKDIGAFLELHDFATFLPHQKSEVQFIRNQFQTYHPDTTPSKFPITSSFGRCLDAIAAGFGVCHQRTYRGEPAMRLEGYIWNESPVKLFDLDAYSRNGQIFIDELIYDYLTHYFLNPQSKGKIQVTKKKLARSLVEDVCRLFAQNATSIAESTGIHQIGFSGGVAYNETITRILKTNIQAKKYEFLTHNSVSPGDAGISYGQIAVIGAKSLQK